MLAAVFDAWATMVGMGDHVIDLADAITSLRELSSAELLDRGLSVVGTFDSIDDPVLVGPDGMPVETWREGYPYDERLCR